jgi:aspartyl-tRNA(Asn)/glutamyl-tRNA(Gln) amidotransferase subunit A
MIATKSSVTQEKQTGEKTMATLPADPFEQGGIARFAERLRKGEISSEEATKAFLERIEILDPKLQAFEYVARDQALATARAMDQLLAAGTDLGPLMGVPMAIKDLVAIDGMPVSAGSNADVSDLVGSEGGFVKKVRRCGCVILGKVTLVEFAFGPLGLNLRRTPWNPWDAQVHRIPGGSSSGSGVAVAAGLCGFAIGSDTGGSVRLPSSFCGTFGMRTNPRLFPMDGVLPLLPVMDTLGPLTRSAVDAALVIGALADLEIPPPAALGGVRLGKPMDHFYDDLDPHVTRCMDAALAALAKAGVDFVEQESPEAAERSKYFPVSMPVNAIGVIGRERFLEIRDQMDPIVALRCGAGLDVNGAEYIRLERYRAEMTKNVMARMASVDGWITPTIAKVAPRVADFDDLDDAMRLTVSITQATQPGSLFDLCGTSTPINGFGSDLPVGMQILYPPDDIAKALSIAMAVEQVLGIPPRADMSKFVS